MTESGAKQLLMNSRGLHEPNNKNISSENFNKQDLEEGKSSVASGGPLVLVKNSPFDLHMAKDSKQYEPSFLYSKREQEENDEPTEIGNFKELGVTPQKVVSQWSRAVILDSNDSCCLNLVIDRGKLYEWGYTTDQLVEIDAVINGKLLSRMQIKDIAVNQQHLLLATGTHHLSLY